MMFKLLSQKESDQGFKLIRRTYFGLCLLSLSSILISFYLNGQWTRNYQASHGHSHNLLFRNVINISATKQEELFTNRSIQLQTVVNTTLNHSALSIAFGEMMTFSSKNKELHFRKKIDFKPTTCPNSIQKKMKEFKWTSQIYREDITLTMHQGAMSMEEYRRLSPYNMPFGLFYRVKLKYQELQDILSKIPREDSILDFGGKEKPTCLSCAIVGNGGNLNGSTFGKEIDGHDLVFRVNNAIRRGFENDVGNRTTHYVLMDRSLKHTSKEDVPRDKGIKYVYLACEKQDYVYIKNMIGPINPELKFNADPKDLRILHPDFVRYILKIWMKMKAFRPTTGWMMFMTALHSGCDVIDVYGMGYTKQYSAHYYEKEYKRFSVYHKNHDYVREIQILKMLDLDGIINWHKRDVKEFLDRSLLKG